MRDLIILVRGPCRYVSTSWQVSMDLLTGKYKLVKDRRRNKFYKTDWIIEQIFCRTEQGKNRQIF